eukprot:3456958-Rhodomonas_salina.1
MGGLLEEVSAELRRAKEKREEEREEALKREEPEREEGARREQERKEKGQREGEKKGGESREEGRERGRENASLRADGAHFEAGAEVFWGEGARFESPSKVSLARLRERVQELKVPYQPTRALGGPLY